VAAGSIRHYTGVIHLWRLPSGWVVCVEVNPSRPAIQKSISSTYTWPQRIRSLTAASAHSTSQAVSMPRAVLSPAAKVQMAHDLRRTIRELRDRGLLVSAKW
jgi:hypothetical protein